MSVLLVGLYLVSDGHWERLLAVSSASSARV
jgi:hypothetical protein